MIAAISSRPTSTRVRRSQPWNIRAGFASQQGARRDRNQDHVLVETSAGVFALADGMGGHEGGAEASELLCAVLAGELMQADVRDDFNVRSAAEVFQAAISVAVDGMRELGRACPDLRRMGTTVVVGWIIDRTLYFGHVGDSRLYLCRDGKLTRLTKDHSFVEELCDRGVVSESGRHTNIWRHYLTRYVGPSSTDARLTVNQLDLADGDRLIFLTDGVTDSLSQETIRKAAEQACSAGELCRWLIAAARNAGAGDDTSCVAVELESRA